MVVADARFDGGRTARSWPVRSNKGVAPALRDGPEALWRPGVELPRRDVHGPVRGSWGAVAKTWAPYVAIAIPYLAIAVECRGGSGLLNWGGRDSSMNNVTYGWEFYTIPLVVFLSVAPLVVAGLAVRWVSKWLTSEREARGRKNRGASEKPADAPPSPPPTTSFRTEASASFGRRRRTEKGSLILNDGGLSFYASRKRPDAPFSKPWSAVVSLQLAPRISWGRCQRGRLTGLTSDGQRFEFMIPRPGYDRLASILDTSSNAAWPHRQQRVGSTRGPLRDARWA